VQGQASIARSGWWNDQVSYAALLHGADQLPVAIGAGGWAREALEDKPSAASRLDPDPWEAEAAWRKRIVDGHAWADPPDYQGVDLTLRSAAIELWPAAKIWVKKHARHVSSSPSSAKMSVSRALVEDAVYSIRATHRNSPPRLSGVLLPLAVDGVWWTSWGPGVTLCSSSSMTDESVAHQIVLETLTSNIVDQGA